METRGTYPGLTSNSEDGMTVMGLSGFQRMFPDKEVTEDMRATGLVYITKDEYGAYDPR